MAFFHGMVLFFRRGAKLSPSEHRITFEESTGQKSVRQTNGLNHFVNPSLGSCKLDYGRLRLAWTRKRLIKN